MTEESCHGWPNRETWNTHRRMTTDRGTDRMAREIVARHLLDVTAGRDARAASEPVRHTVALAFAAAGLRNWWDAAFAPTIGSPLSDPWSRAIARTDWSRIAAAFELDDELAASVRADELEAALE